MRFIEEKAFFMMVIMIGSLFSISLLNIHGAYAQPVSGQQQVQQACCQRTIDGEVCQYTDSNRCDPDFGVNFATCEQTSFCKVGSCFVESEGKCFRNVGKATCEERQGQFFDAPDCEIPAAQEGCCIIGDEAFFTTQARCKIETAKFPNVQMSFDEAVQTEVQCLQKSFSNELGACVNSDGTCTLTTQQLCNINNEDINGLQAGFHRGILCSNPELGTECARQQTTGCVGEDVYWFDSCGNQENIFNSNRDISYNNGIILTDAEADGICNANPNDPDCGNCDYAAGTLCGESGVVDPSFGNFICRSTACLVTSDDATSPSAGTSKQSGESWCLYDGAVGQGRDLVGSRHFRASCINGEEIIESCRDFREELCFQDTIKDGSLSDVGIQQGFVEAACRTNRFETCTEANSEITCGGECDGLEDPDDNTDINEAQAFCCSQRACDDIEKRDCFWSQTGVLAIPLSEEALKNIREDPAKYGDITPGVCVPDVPPGIKFWSDDIDFIESTTRSDPADIRTSGSSPDADETICEAGNLDCTVVWQRGGIGRIFGGGWEIVQNEHCTKPEWVIAGNNLCSSLGDCGAYFNIVGESTLDGYSNSASSEREKDGLFFDGHKLEDKDVGNFNLLSAGDANEEIPGKWNYFTPGGPRALVLLVGLGISAKLTGAATFGKFGIPFAKFGIKEAIGKTAALEAAKNAARDAAYRNAISQGLTEEAAKKAGEDAAGKITSGTLTRVLAIVNIALWAYTIYSLIDVLLAQTKEKTYSIGCGIWQPPEGGSQCESCNDDPNRPCSEYRCKSLGTQCSLVNQGTTEEKCIAVNVDDARSPRITPWKEVITSEISEQPNGFTLNEEIDPFTPFTVGIQTDEPAQCRFDSEIGKTYDDMIAFFGGQFYVNDHQITINLPAELTTEDALRRTNQGEHTLYVKCKDSAGNRNERDYFVRFKIKPGPDLTPPKIEQVSPLNGAFIRNDVTETPVSAFVNEPAECRWSRNNVDFDVMENEFQCQTDGFSISALNYGLYECKTTLSNLEIGDNEFFFRCKDQPGEPEQDRNLMQQGFLYELKRTNELNLESIGPSGTLFNGNVTLEVVTSGGAENGKAVCGFSTDKSDIFANTIEFVGTNSNLHQQSLILNTGRYEYFVTCRDVAGNEVKASTNFDVAVDLSAPEILRIYTTGTTLNLELDEEVDCESSTQNFVFGGGNLMSKANGVHSTPIAEKVNIICEDAFDNQLGFTVYP